MTKQELEARNKLLEFAKSLKINTKDKVNTALQEMGYKQKYKEEDFERCSALLIEWVAKQLEKNRQERVEAMLKHAKDTEPKQLPECPIHKCKTTRHAPYDGFLGVKYGWSCNQGGTHCFVETAWAPIMERVLAKQHSKLEEKHDA